MCWRSDAYSACRSCPSKHTPPALGARAPPTHLANVEPARPRRADDRGQRPRPRANQHIAQELAPVRRPQTQSMHLQAIALGPSPFARQPRWRAYRPPEPAPSRCRAPCQRTLTSNHPPPQPDSRSPEQRPGTAWSWRRPRPAGTSRREPEPQSCSTSTTRSPRSSASQSSKRKSRCSALW
jgi:hypothetical protein